MKRSSYSWSRVVGWIIAIAFACWIFGALLQLGLYGSITEPCCK